MSRHVRHMRLAAGGLIFCCVALMVNTVCDYATSSSVTSWLFDLNVSPIELYSFCCMSLIVFVQTLKFLSLVVNFFVCISAKYAFLLISFGRSVWMRFFYTVVLVFTVSTVTFWHRLKVMVSCAIIACNFCAIIVQLFFMSFCVQLLHAVVAVCCMQ